jgi:hypothetical protein
MSDDNNPMQREIVSEVQFKDLDRVSMPNYIDIDMYIDLVSKKRNKLFMSSLEKFVKNVYQIGKDLIENGLLSIKDLENILNNIATLDNPQYKNATAYLLGYIASDGGTNLDPKNAENLLRKFNTLEKNKFFEDDTIDCAAIIRYARLWVSMISKKTYFKY